jgi:hypothetical protein
MLFGLIDRPPLRLPPSPQASRVGDIGPAGRGAYARSSRVKPLVGLACTVIAMCVFCLPLSSASAQTFGNGKKKVTLQRRLPAAVHFTGTSFDVRVTARDAAQNNVAQTLLDRLPTELQREDMRLHVDNAAPDLQVICTITGFETPAPVPFSRNEVTMQKNAAPKQYYKVTGTLTVSYQARDHNSRVIDSDNITAKYSEDFEQGTNAAANESIGAKVVDPFKRLAGKKTEETATAPTPVELRSILVTRVVSQIAARLVNTNEVIEVALAHGKQLDEPVKLAEGGLWSRYLETLETMQPFPDPTLDAYRLYDIGVGYEAEAYKSEDHAAAKKLLDEAAINYGKAIDAKPGEKYFMEPQSRIETAIEHYRALEASTAAASAHPPVAAASTQPAPATATTSAPPAKTGTGTRSATPHSGSASSTPKTSTTNKNPSSGGSSSGQKTPAAPAASALTNAQIIKMAKSGVDDDTIIGAIHDAASVQFDLSPDALIQLAQNGVKGKVVSAMRDRDKRSTHRSSPPASN